MRTLAMICSRGKLFPARKATEQNWQPRPHPRVISTAPNVERCRSGGLDDDQCQGVPEKFAAWEDSLLKSATYV